MCQMFNINWNIKSEMIKLNVESLKKMLNSAQILLYFGSYRYFQPGRDNKIEWDDFDRMAWN